MRSIIRVDQKLVEIDKQIQNLYEQRDRLSKERAVLALNSAKSAGESKKNLENRRREQWQGQIEVGDFVRVVGGRNSRTPWRKVTAVNMLGKTGQTASITGQICIREHRPDRFVLTPYMSTNGIEKVAEVVKAGYVEV